MLSLAIPLDRLIVDVDKEIDLFGLPTEEVERLVREAYSFLPTPYEISISNGIAHVTHLKKPPKNAADAEELFQRGLKFAERGNYSRAIELFGRVLERIPGHVEARRNLGMALLETGKIAEARQRLVETSRLDINDVWTYLLIANSFSKYDKRLEDALRFYHIAYALNPRDPYLLTSFGGVLCQMGRTARGKELLQEALDIEPNYPNAAYGLALVEFNEGHPLETDRILMHLLNSPVSSDGRSAPIYNASYELILKANLQIAEKNIVRGREIVEARRLELEAVGGIPIEVKEDSTIATQAVTQMAWNHGRSVHHVRYKNAKPVLVPHYLAHELEHIDIETKARALERNRAFASSAQNREQAIRSMERDISRLQKQGYAESQIMDLVLQLQNGLTSQLFNIPLDMLIESRLYNGLPDLRPSQLVSLYANHKEVEQLYQNAEIKRVTPTVIFESSAALNYAYALFTDKLFEGRTSFAPMFSQLPSMSSDAVTKGKKIFGFFEEMMGPDGQKYQHGDEYSFVDRVAELLSLNEWYEWRFQGEEGSNSSSPTAAPITDFDRPEGTTNPELLRSKDMATVMYLVSTLKRFASLSDSEVRDIAFEVGMVGAGGIDYADPDRKYHLRTLPGEEFTGLQLLSLMYVGFKRIAPDQDTGLDFAEQYATALQLYGLNQGEH